MSVLVIIRTLFHTQINVNFLQHGTERADWLSGNVPELYLGDPRFEFQISATPTEIFLGSPQPF